MGGALGAAGSHRANHFGANFGHHGTRVHDAWELAETAEIDRDGDVEALHLALLTETGAAGREDPQPSPPAAVGPPRPRPARLACESFRSEAEEGSGPPSRASTGRDGTPTLAAPAVRSAPASVTELAPEDRPWYHARPRRVAGPIAAPRAIWAPAGPTQFLNLPPEIAEHTPPPPPPPPTPAEGSARRGSAPTLGESPERPPQPRRGSLAPRDRARSNSPADGLRIAVFRSPADEVRRPPSLPLGVPQPQPHADIHALSPPPASAFGIPPRRPTPRPPISSVIPPALFRWRQASFPAPHSPSASPAARPADVPRPWAAPRIAFDSVPTPVEPAAAHRRGSAPLPPPQAAYPPHVHPRRGSAPAAAVLGPRAPAACRDFLQVPSLEHEVKAFE